MPGYADVCNEIFWPDSMSLDCGRFNQLGVKRNALLRVVLPGVEPLSEGRRVEVWVDS